ncbi:MAG: putative quinol monooxygenase [Betaproteobacteria bacterium]
MIRLIAQYRIKQGTLDKVQPAIRKFVAAVEREEPETDYRAYRLGDTDDFLHVMAFPDSAAQKRHQKANYTSEFVDSLYPNCVEPPRFTSIELVR